MPTWQSVLVAAVAFAFASFIVWKYRPMGLFAKAPRIGEDVKRAREKARSASGPRERSAALLEAGDLSARDPDHRTAAIGYYLRAMRADPAWAEPILRARHMMEKRRPRTLEKILWRRLAAVPWTGETSDVARAAAEGLVAIYKARPLARDQAAALKKLVEKL